MNWTNWKALPAPESCRKIEGPLGPGAYQVRNKKTDQFILFGIGIRCQERMQSLFPKPHGKGTKNNENKRNFILKNLQDLDFRTIQTETKSDVKKIEDELKSQNNHLFNT